MNDIALLLGITAILSAALLYQGYRKTIDELDERVRKLEEAGKKRMNYNSLLEIENAMAELAAFETEQEIMNLRLESIRKHMSRAHTPPKK